jgi:hypothetical protein
MDEIPKKEKRSGHRTQWTSIRFERPSPRNNVSNAPLTRANPGFGLRQQRCKALGSSLKPLRLAMACSRQPWVPKCFGRYPAGAILNFLSVEVP